MPTTLPSAQRVATVLLAAVLAIALLPPPVADAQDSASTGASLVISQVYGGGGNNGAPLTNDYVELHNRSDAPIDLAGRSVQYASSTGTGDFGGNAGQLVALSGTVAPGGYHLISLGGGSTGEPLPAADDTGTIQMSASAGKVALVEGTDGLGCNGGSTPCDDDQLDRIIDLVGFGNANFYEGNGAAPTLNSSTAAFRHDDGGKDTDDNAADFTTGSPAPRNSSTGGGGENPEDTPVTISQAYGGGGNSGAPFTHDFVELHNRSDAAVDLSGRSVQYASSTGTGNIGANAGQLVALSGTIAPGGYHLVQLGGGSTGEPLPAPDDTGTISMAAGAGKVALVEGTDGLGCNGGSTPCDDEQLARIVDLVGYGSANFYEGTGAAPTLSNTTAALREQGGAQDTDDNAADFTAASPAPRNSGAEPEDPEDPDEPLPDVDQCLVPGEERTAINEIQGSGTATPIDGQRVVTTGVVTADFTSGGASDIPANEGSRGFYIEALAEDRDADPQTSEGVFVFEPDATFDGAIGNLVAVAGTAGESFGMTQVTATDVDICDDADLTATLPAPAALPLPVAPEDRATVLEPLESMRVTHPELTVVEFYQLERYGEVRLSSGGVFDNPTNVVSPHDDDAYHKIVDFNAANNIVLDNGATGQNLDPLPYVVPGDTLRIGDQLRDATTVLNFGFGSWRLSPIDVDELTEQLRTNRTRPRPLSPPDVGGTLTVGSFNVLNYFNGDGQGGGFPTARGAVTASELERQTTKLVAAMTAIDADIVGLIEMENDAGPHQATQTLVDALNAEHGEVVYDFVDTGVIGTDAIKQAFIYKPATVEPVGPFAILDSEVDPRFEDQRNRPVLAQTFEERATGRSVTVAVNHLKSKGSGCGAADDDPRQGNCNGSRDRAAQAMVDWLAENPTGQPAAGNLIIGDINAYAKEDPITTILEAGYRDLLEAFADPDGPAPYSYTFDATQGRLDHALADTGLVPFVTGAEAWHINADETQAIDYQESTGGVSFNQRFRTARTAELFYQPNAFRSSDHDPVLVGLALPACPGNSQGNGTAKGTEGCPGKSAGRGTHTPVPAVPNRP